MDRTESVKTLFQSVLRLILFIPFSVDAAFTLVATHPEASSRYYTTPQPSPYELSYLGREIKVLRAFNNRLYIGYGQDEGRVKPGTCTTYGTLGAYCDLVVRYYDPNTGLSSPQAYFRSQEMDTFEVLNGNLYIPAEDRDGSADYIKCTTSQCTQGSFDNGTSGHIYSATEMNGVIFMAGSAYPDDAAVWRSSNNGGYWTVSLQVPPVQGYSDVARAYHVGGPYNGKLYVRPYDWLNGSHYYTRRYNGTSWSSVYIPDLHAITNRMREFAGKLVYRWGSLLNEFDGSSVVNNYTPAIRDFTISGEWLYVLNSSSSYSTIRRTKNLTSWQYVDTAPTDAISLEVLNNSVYVGTNDSEIYKSDVDLDHLINVVPPMYLLLLDN